MSKVTEEKLKAIIKEIINEAFAKEMMKLRALILPYISKKEQKEIERKYGKKPSFKVAKRLKIKI